MKKRETSPWRGRARPKRAELSGEMADVMAGLHFVLKVCDASQTRRTARDGPTEEDGLIKANKQTNKQGILGC